MSIGSSGDIKIDILNDEILGNIENITAEQLNASPVLHQIMASHLENKWPESCHRCKTKETMVGKSRRTFLFYNLGFHMNPQKFSTTNLSIRYLDINGSNKCNLKCTMCNGQISTSWIKDEKRLSKLGRGYWRPSAHKAASWDPVNLIRLFETSDIFDSLSHVALRGGEPLYEPHNFQILDYLIKSGRAKRIILDVSTNGTVLDESFMDYCREFKRVDIYVSIEAVGDLYRYIRGGQNFSVDDLLANCLPFMNVDNIRFCFAITSSAHNVMRIPQLWQTLKQYTPACEIAFNNVVVSPSYLNMNVLPRVLKESAIEGILSGDIPQMTASRFVADYESGIKQLIDGLRVELWDESRRELEWRSFVRYTRDLDNIRDTDFFSIVPEMRDYI